MHFWRYLQNWFLWSFASCKVDWMGWKSVSIFRNPEREIIIKISEHWRKLSQWCLLPTQTLFSAFGVQNWRQHFQQFRMGIGYIKIQLYSKHVKSIVRLPFSTGTCDIIIQHSSKYTAKLANGLYFYFRVYCDEWNKALIKIVGVRMSFAENIRWHWNIHFTAWITAATPFLFQTANHALPV